MKIRMLVLVAMTIVLVFSCFDTKQTKPEPLYNHLWELEFISGSRIAFNALYPDKKPLIIFNREAKEVEGSNSCNGYRTNFFISENKITFGEPEPTTMVFCGQGELTFLNMMKKVNAYDFDESGKLLLKIDKTIVMRFSIK